MKEVFPPAGLQRAPHLLDSGEVGKSWRSLLRRGRELERGSGRTHLPPPSSHPSLSPELGCPRFPPSCCLANPLQLGEVERPAAGTRGSKTFSLPLSRCFPTNWVQELFITDWTSCQAQLTLSSSISVTTRLLHIPTVLPVLKQRKSANDAKANDEQKSSVFMMLKNQLHCVTQLCLI